MKLVVNNPNVDPKVIERAMDDLMMGEHRNDFLGIIGWLIKTGLNDKEARQNLINSLTSCITNRLWEGMIQVTIQELEGETEIKPTFQKELPALFPYIDFRVKSGAIEIWKTDYWFKATTKVAVNDLSVTMKDEEITAVKSGVMQAFLTLAYCSHEKETKDPSVLIEEKKVLDLKLPELVSFQ